MLSGLTSCGHNFRPAATSTIPFTRLLSMMSRCHAGSRHSGQHPFTRTASSMQLRQNVCPHIPFIISYSASHASHTSHHWLVLWTPTPTTTTTTTINRNSNSNTLVVNRAILGELFCELFETLGTIWRTIMKEYNQGRHSTTWNATRTGNMERS